MNHIILLGLADRNGFVRDIGNGEKRAIKRSLGLGLSLLEFFDLRRQALHFRNLLQKLR